VKRRKPYSSAAQLMPIPAISRSSAPIVPLPSGMRQFGSWLSSARVGRGDQLHHLVEHKADPDRRQQRRDPR
jgi:hypothetical protein